MKTTTVQLVTATTVAYDPLGAPIEEEELVDVPGVLVGQPSSTDVETTISMYGKRIDYMLGIPKGDTHNWVDTYVYIWGRKYRTIGYPITGEMANIPLKWGQNIRVESYG